MQNIVFNVLLLERIASVTKKYSLREKKTATCSVQWVVAGEACKRAKFLFVARRIMQNVMFQGLLIERNANVKNSFSLRAK